MTVHPIDLDTRRHPGHGQPTLEDGTVDVRALCARLDENANRGAATGPASFDRCPNCAKPMTPFGHGERAELEDWRRCEDCDITEADA